MYEIAKLVNEVKAGDKSPLDLAIALKRVENYLEELKANKEIQDLIHTEAARHSDGGEFMYNGIRMQISYINKYDYQSVDDESWNFLNLEIENLKKKQKNIEENLRKFAPKTSKICLKIFKK